MSTLPPQSNTLAFAKVLFKLALRADRSDALTIDCDCDIAHNRRVVHLTSPVCFGWTPAVTTWDA